MSIWNTRFSRWAQVIAMDGMYAGFAGAKTGHGGMAFGRCFIFRVGAVFVLDATLASPCWCDHCPLFAVRCKDTMKPCQVDPGLRHQSGQPRNEVQWL